MTALIALISAVTAFAAEKSGSVLIKNATVDKKGNTEVRVYLDTTGNGVTDTELNFQKSVKPKEDSACIAELDSLIKVGSRITFDDRFIRHPSRYFETIIWPDLIMIDDISMAQRFPNPDWFPSAFGIR
jgi:hypothetical protein